MTSARASRRSGEGVPGNAVALLATTIFVGIQMIATVHPVGWSVALSVGWSLAMFAWGAFAFLAAFVVAGSRSRDEILTMRGVVWLTGAAPARAARAFRSYLGIQVAGALLGAAIRPFTPLAFGILAPMFGLGAMAWHGARHGSFPMIGQAVGAAGPGDEDLGPPSESGARGVGRSMSESEDPDDFDQLFKRRKR